MAAGIFLGMYNIPRFHYHRPSSLEECFDLMETYANRSKVIAGGTDLMPALRSGKLKLSPDYHLIDISRLNEIRYVKENDGLICIGSATTLSEIQKSEVVKNRIPVLAQVMEKMGSLQVRHMATIGGNLCNASPAADSAIPLLILGASVRIGSRRGEREISLSDFFLGPGKTVLGPDELLLEIRVPMPSPDAVCTFYKLGRRNAFTLSVVSVGVYLEKNGETVKTSRIALGAVAPIPMRAREVENYLIGKKLDESTIEEAASLVENEVKPITDVRGSEWYRKEMARNLVKKMLSSGL